MLGPHCALGSLASAQVAHSTLHLPPCGSASARPAGAFPRPPVEQAVRPSTARLWRHRPRGGNHADRVAAHEIVVQHQQAESKTGCRLHGSARRFLGKLLLTDGCRFPPLGGSHRGHSIPRVLTPREQRMPAMAAGTVADERTERNRELETARNGVGGGDGEVRCGDCGV